jgi:hypothetical protein
MLVSATILFISVPESHFNCFPRIGRLKFEIAMGEDSSAALPICRPHEFAVLAGVFSLHQ